MKKFLLVALLLSASVCFSQSNPPQPQQGSKDVEKSVEWINIRVPIYPPIVRTAHIIGTVTIDVRFKGCELDPSSPTVVSGPPLLRQGAIDALKQSTIRCGDFHDSRAAIYYDFGFGENLKCDARLSRLEAIGDHIKILAAPECVEAEAKY
jgi:hypothetical protein